MKDHDVENFVDIHSHLVPGVDDGARAIEDTLTSVGNMSNVGIRKILTTPHLKGSLTHSSVAIEDRLQEVDEAFEMAAERVKEDFHEIEFKRGHEVMLDVPDVDFSDPRVRLSGTSFVLIEWPLLRVPPSTSVAIEGIVNEGYRPIVAHPERYSTDRGNDYYLDLIQEWKAIGAYMQINYGSVIGRYGSNPCRVSMQLIRRGWADYLASDFHGQSGVKIYLSEARERLEPLCGEESLKHLFLTNPDRVFHDEAPVPVSAVTSKIGLWEKAKNLISSR